MTAGGLAFAATKQMVPRGGSFHTMFEHTMTGMVVNDTRTKRFVHANAAFAKLTGYTRGELLERAWTDLIHPEDAETALEEWRDLVAEKTHSASRDVRLVRKNGDVVWVRATVAAEAGSADALIGLVEELPTHPAAEDLRRLQAEALEATDDGIVITDAEGKIEWVNAAVGRLTGYEPNTLVGRFASTLGAADGDAVSQQMTQAMQSGRVWRGEITSQRTDGTTYPEELSITPVLDASGRVTHGIAIKRDVSRRWVAQEQYQALVDNLDDVVFSTDADGRFTYVNRAIARFGYRPEQVIGRHFNELAHPDDRSRGRKSEHDTTMSAPAEWRLLDASGKARFVRSSSRAVVVDGKFVGRTGIVVDLTAQRAVEEELRAAQKMEAVGQLAGGVAHDFNNILSVILSYTESTLASLPENDPLRADLSEVDRAGRRAASLTRQLLAFSRRQVLEIETVDVGPLIDDVTKMLRRLIGEDIQLTLRGDAVDAVRADRGQLEQVLMNLAVNARDAMPQGGELVIATSNVKLDAARAKALGTQPGAYVQIEVADTGMGMDEATRARIFEPFFTTKGLGKGTGLGLSTVYGIVKQSHGAIEVESSPGQGACFRIVLPRDPEETRTETPIPVRARNRNGDETILVVEDESALRNVIERTLRSAGYRVLVAASGDDVAGLAPHECKDIDLLLTDVVMPGMSGTALATALRAASPALRVLFMSGYADAMDRAEVASFPFLKKPFDCTDLTEKVRGVLDSPLVSSSSPAR